MNERSMVVIVVAYGHAQTLPATLQALAQQTVQPAELVVVDNGDGSSAAVARTLVPTAHVLLPGENLGFAGGCTLAVNASTAPLIALINPDVVLEPQWIATVTNALQEHGGIVGGKLLYPDGKLQHAGGMIDWPLALTDHRGTGTADQGQWDTAGPVDYVTGAALALPRTVWQALAGLDAHFYPAYFEEVDLCVRAAAAGYKVTYLPTARGLHAEASGLGKSSVTYLALYHLNRLRLLWKLRPDPWLITTWLPAELQHLRTTADDREIAALVWAYSRWQTALLAGEDWRARIDGWESVAEPQTVPGELGWMLRQVAAKRTMLPQPFRSRWPLVARFQTLWNRIATEPYLRPLIQQQNDYHAALGELAQALERQRRSTDAAILAQGALLAKCWGDASRRTGSQ